jgi:hypothetical protein
MEIQFALLSSCEIFGIVVNNETKVATATASFQRHIHDPVLSSLKMEGNVYFFSYLTDKCQPIAPPALRCTPRVGEVLLIDDGI